MIHIIYSFELKVAVRILYGLRTRSNRYYTKSDFTVDEGKERLNHSREKNKGVHRGRKVDENSCVTFLLCDPGWYIQ